MVLLEFIISDKAHCSGFAIDALESDPCRRLAILASGHDSKGDEWSHWCRFRGQKPAMRANNLVDLLTGTGTAMSEQTIPRRAYRVRIPSFDADGGSLRPTYR